jgi:hypothetical protein
MTLSEAIFVMETRRDDSVREYPRCGEVTSTMVVDDEGRTTCYAIYLVRIINPACSMANHHDGKERR